MYSASSSYKSIYNCSYTAIWLSFFYCNKLCFCEIVQPSKEECQTTLESSAVCWKNRNVCGRWSRPLAQSIPITKVRREESICAERSRLICSAINPLNCMKFFDFFVIEGNRLTKFFAGILAALSRWIFRQQELSQKDLVSLTRNLFMEWLIPILSEL